MEEIDVNSTDYENKMQKPRIKSIEVIRKSSDVDYKTSPENKSFSLIIENFVNNSERSENVDEANENVMDGNLKDLVGREEIFTQSLADNSNSFQYEGEVFVVQKDDVVFEFDLIKSHSQNIEPAFIHNNNINPVLIEEINVESLQQEILSLHDPSKVTSANSDTSCKPLKSVLSIIDNKILQENKDDSKTNSILNNEDAAEQENVNAGKEI